MVMIELRENAYDTAFELLEEAKHSAKKTKLTLCELEDAMYDCYEASSKEHKDGEDEKEDIEFRGVTGYHDEDDEERMDNRHIAHRLRSNRMRMRRRLV